MKKKCQHLFVSNVRQELPSSKSTPPRHLFFGDRGNTSLIDPHSTVKICERKIPAPGCGEAKESHEGCNMPKHHKSFTLQSPSFEVSCTPLRIFFGNPAGSVFSCSSEEILAATPGLKALESSIDTPNLFVFCAKFLP